jgi:hypothetical protein
MSSGFMRHAAMDGRLCIRGRARRSSGGVNVAYLERVGQISC